jgi:signal transduction histidine kinase
MVARRRSLRFRITFAATVVVTIALLVGAALFVVILRTSLVEGVYSAATTDAASLATTVEEAGLDAVDDDEDEDDRLFQLVSPSGSIVVASENASRTVLSGDTVVVDGVEFLLAQTDAEVDDSSDDDADTEDQDVTVIAGRSAATAVSTVVTVIVLLAVALPLLAALIALTTWFTVGRALRPVERMRLEVDGVSSTNLAHRIADPGSDDEIGRLATTMNLMLDRLDEAQRTQRRFVSDASHELKSPLASLRQFAEVASAHPDRVSAAELSEAVLDEGARLERLVQGMLVLARADEHSLLAARTSVDLDDILFAEAKRLASSSSVRVDVSAVGAARAHADEAMLHQLVRNLVDNAVRHAVTTVAFSLTESASGILLAIEDDGDGVPRAERERIFERFVRLDEARAREAGGSGLGLAIVRELVAAHGGTVTVSESLLGGARFEVRLPAAS